MGLRDVLFGRSQPVAPKLESLFALPSAALTLESQLDLIPSGQAGLCFKAASGGAQTTTDEQLRALLELDQPGVTATLNEDDLGFKWFVVEGSDLSDLVTRIHSANTTLVDNGLGTHLLCAVFGFVPKTPPGEGAVRIVYLLKQGTFYPFAPIGAEKRDNEFELRVRSFLGDDLPIEKDLARWMALWNVPVK